MTEFVNPFEETEEVARAKLVAETAKIEWQALQRFFAAGKAIAVASGHDLVDVAYAVSCDDASALKNWVDVSAVSPVSDEQARVWFESQASVWAVVVRPWVFVQAID